MACERWREMISAQLDGQDDPADRPGVDEHLAGCAGCRQWLDEAAMVTRLTRTAVATPGADLTAAILATVSAARPRRTLITSDRLFAALAAVGAVQLILGLTQVGGGASGAHLHVGLDATPGHLWHESAAWNVAVGAALLFIALRRTRPSGLVPLLTAFVGMLLLLSVNDLSAGRVDATRLVSHGFVIAGYLLVVALTRIAPTPVGSPAGRLPDDSGWRAWFGDDLGADQSGVGPRPVLRLVPRGPMTAVRRDDRRAA